MGISSVAPLSHPGAVSEPPRIPEKLRDRRKWKNLFRFEQGDDQHVDPDTHEATGELLKARVTRASLILFWTFVKPHSKWVCVIGLLTLVNEAMTVVLPVAIGHLFDVALPMHDASLLNAMVLGLGVFVVVRALLLFVHRYLMMQTGQLIIRDVRHRMHAHMQRMSLRFLENYQVGRIVSRIVGDSEQLTNLLGGGVIQSIANCLRLIFAVATLLYVDWQLTVVSCITMPFFIAGMFRFLRKLQPAQKELSEDRSRLWARATETFSGMRVVKTYGKEAREDLGFTSRVHMMIRKAVLLHFTHAVVVIFWELSYYIGFVAMLWFGGHRVMSGGMSVGELLAFSGLMGLMYGPIAELINVSATVQAAMASTERIGEILGIQSEAKKHPGTRDARTLKGDVEFKDVGFKYEEANGIRDERKREGRPDSAGKRRARTLEDISFKVRAGQCVALVGSSGAGKSTLTNLLARFYEPDSGSIRVDGHDIQEYGLDSYRRNLAIVLQDTFLFNGSIRENIAYSKPSATDEEIVRAARMAGAWDFIQESERGLDTFCGERGFRLSGGQKQRLSIARAILADPRILILDEATSALDSQTEAQIQRALEKLMKDRTTFVIAHRLSTIVNADLIIAMAEGRIIEMGTHEELLAKGGLYFDMFKEQYGKIRLNAQAAIALTDDPVAANACAVDPCMKAG